MANNDTGVTMSIAGYNQMKSENTKMTMFIDRIFEEATISDDKSSLVFDTKVVDQVAHLCFPERYKKKLSYLRGLETKTAMKELKERERSEGS